MFKNAYEGIKKIHLAQLLALCASVLMIVGSIITLINAQKSTEEAATAFTIYGAIIMLSLIAMLASFILNLIGLNKAKTDDKNFNTALILTILGIVVSIVGGFFTKNELVKNLINVGTNVISLLACVFVVKGIINLATELGNLEVIAKGAYILKLVISIQGLAIIANIIALIFGGNQTGATIAAIMGLIAGILSIVFYFFYLSILGKAKNMLAKA